MKKLFLRLMVISLVTALLGISCKKANRGCHILPNNDDTIVKICNQEWMVKNMEVSTYRNGDPIPQVTDPVAWSALTSGAWCWYNNDPATHGTYGKLYNWYAVNDPRGLAPTGWHIPSDAEWTILSTCLGGEEVAGGKMKEAGTVHWLSPNTGATNNSGFVALPGGARDYEGRFIALGITGTWWSSSTDRAGYPLVRFMDHRNSLLSAGPYNPKTFGLSVRCLKD